MWILRDSPNIASTPATLTGVIKPKFSRRPSGLRGEMLIGYAAHCSWLLCRTKELLERGMRRTPMRRVENLPYKFRRSTTHPASMSCSACFLSVNPDMMYPINAGTMLVIIFAKCLPVERPKLTRCPAISVTTRPSTFFPTVACHSELSISAWYNHVKTRLTVAARKITPMSMKMPTSFMSSLGWISSRNPRNPVRKMSGINIKTKPKPITTLSMRSAKNRSQNPAYSTRDTTAFPANAGMAAEPPPSVAATDALIIGARGGAAATANDCPQLEQNAAPSAIAAPHLEQYTVSPSLIPDRSGNRQESQPNPTFKDGQGQSSTGECESGKNFIGLVLNPSLWPLHAIPRISLISRMLYGKWKLPSLWFISCFD